MFQIHSWTSENEYILTYLSFSVGILNFQLLPYLFYKHGGIIFFIPFLLIYTLIYFPLSLLESLLGQFSKNTSIKLWSIAPVFEGVGYGQMIILFYFLAVMIVKVSYALFYLSVSFPINFYERKLTNILPYSENSRLCTELAIISQGSRQLNGGNQSCTERFFDRAVLKQIPFRGEGEEKDQRSGAFAEYSLEGSALLESTGIEEPGSDSFQILDEIKYSPTTNSFNWKLNPGLIIAGFILLIIQYLSQLPSSRNTQKIKVKKITSLFILTTILPYFCLVTLLIFMFSHRDALKFGIFRYFSINSDISSFSDIKTKLLGSSEIWMDAIQVIIFQSGLLLGILPVFSAHNKYNCRVIFVNFKIAMVQLFSALGYSMLLFCFIGVAFPERERELRLRPELHDKINQLTNFNEKYHESFLTFIVVPLALDKLPVSMLWALLYYLMIFLLGLGSILGMFLALQESIFQKLESAKKVKLLQNLYESRFLLTNYSASSNCNKRNSKGIRNKNVSGDTVLLPDSESISFQKASNSQETAKNNKTATSPQEKWSNIVTIILLLLISLISIPFYTYSGFSILNYYNQKISIIIPNFLALLKLIGICYFYGISSFIEDIEAMLEYSSKPKFNDTRSNNGLKIWWKLSWGYLGPIFYSAVIVFKTVQMIKVWLDERYLDQNLPEEFMINNEKSITHWLIEFIIFQIIPILPFFIILCLKFGQKVRYSYYANRFYNEGKLNETRTEVGEMSLGFYQTLSRNRSTDF